MDYRHTAFRRDDAACIGDISAYRATADACPRDALPYPFACALVPSNTDRTVITLRAFISCVSATAYILFGLRLDVRTFGGLRFGLRVHYL